MSLRSTAAADSAASAPSTASATKTKVSLKLEYLQVSGSFKDRGISHMVRTLAVPGVERVVCSSGGNAGNAVAAAGERLGLPVDVYVPTTTLPMMIEKIRGNADTTVHVQGENWNAANAHALEAIEKAGGVAGGVDGGKCIYIPPYDHPLIWEGNSSLVDELLEDCGGIDNVEQFPQCIVLSVGGGGLLRGVQLGLERLGLTGRCEVFTVETEGSACFHAAKAAGEVVRLKSIDSIATSLGALSVVPSCLESPVKTTAFTVSDDEALDACYAFANEHKALVEPACGAALALATKRPEAFVGISSAVFVVCGGSAVSLDMLAEYRTKIRDQAEQRLATQ